MKNILLIFFLTPTLIFSQTWEKTYNEGYGYSAIQTSDGGYIISGQETDDYKLYIIKTDSFGDTIWTKKLEGCGRGFAIQKTNNDSYIITGLYFEGTWVYDVYLIRIDNEGTIQWTKQIGEGNRIESGLSVQQTYDNGFIIAGYYTISYESNEDIYLIKTDSVGDTTWTRKYGGYGLDRGYCVQQTTDSGYIITGNISSNICLIKTSDYGDTLWTKYYPGTGKGYSVQQTFDGGYIITGYINSSNNHRDVYVIKTDNNGDTTWTRTYGGIYSDVGESVKQTTDGGYIIAGWTKSTNYGYSDIYLIKTDETGDTLWTKMIGGNGEQIGMSVQQTSDQGFIVSGWSKPEGASRSMLYLVKTDANGIIVSTTEVEVNKTKKEVIKIVDLSGREIIKPQNKVPYIEIYNDGTTQKKMIIK